MRLAGLTLSILLGVLLLQVVTAVKKKGTCSAPPPNIEFCKNIKYWCKDDSDCKGTMKCCPSLCNYMCKEPVLEVKPGTCPVAMTFAPCKLPIPRTCRADSDCFGTKKCCNFGCSISCQEPTETKPGTCPRFPVGIVPCSLQNIPKEPRQCYTDKHCTGKKKCCSSGCRYICAYPIGKRSRTDTTSTFQSPKVIPPASKDTLLII
ncbi:WAP four-disulfide core domain protein 5-like [Rana temporaria]|uniref:WAP four-disulfide core domain protein 5-like n=1 Tax=Rana temporaria TaxID=8407 RepID=UPI001AAD75B4|nr:WAP four-disulfide core domain protein 5-like [Rana temporaria]